MPEYSTLQWDITSGGTEVSYGYAVTVTKGDKEPIQFIVSDRFSKEWAKCSPPQIINAYGGSSSLNFVPTQYTNSCNRHAQRMNYKEVRKEIIKDLVKNITRRLTSIKVSSTTNGSKDANEIFQNFEPALHLEPTSVVQPKYPRKALNRGLSGWVIVEFEVTELGTVENPRIVSNCAWKKKTSIEGECFDNTNTVFNKEGIKAALKFQYPSVPQSKVRNKVSWNLI